MRSRGGSVVAAAAFAVAAAVAVSGCSGPDTTGPEQTAAAFAQAVFAADGSLACGLLSPEVQSAVAESAGTACPVALLQEDLPAPSPARRVERYGQQAFVTTGTDTMFLAVFPDGWKVTAAGCRPQGDKPYNCAVSGD